MRTWWEVADVVRGDVVRAREWRRKPNQHGRTGPPRADSGECFPGVTLAREMRKPSGLTRVR